MTQDRPAAEPDDAVHVDLPPDLTAAGAAREQTRAALRRWRLPDLLDPVALAVSELVSNAVRHGRPPVVMLLRRTSRNVRVEVHDEAPAHDVPTVPALSAEAESGRGLLIIDALSGDTGVEQVPGDGKVTWASFDA